MSTFKSITEVTERDRKFTSICEAIRAELKDDFCYFDSGYGYDTNDLNEFMADNMRSAFYEKEDGDLELYWAASSLYAVRLMRWLADWDMVAMGEDVAVYCDEERSNHPRVAALLNELVLV